MIDRVSEVFSAALDDGLISRNPLHAKSVTRPNPDKHEAIPFTLGELDALSLALRHRPGCPADCDRCKPSRYEILPYLGAATGQRQGEMFAIDTEKDIHFLRRVPHVRRQVKIIRGKQVFAPLKNDKTHDVPLTDAAVVMLSEYIRAWPPERVTLPWAKADGDRATFTLLLSRDPGLAMHRKPVNDRWRAALKRAGIDCDRYHMMHVLRHTAASAWLSAAISVRAVAEFPRDAEATVQATYSHMMPDDRERARKAMELFFTVPIAQPAGRRQAAAMCPDRARYCLRAPRERPLHPVSRQLRFRPTGQLTPVPHGACSDLLRMVETVSGLHFYVLTLLIVSGFFPLRCALAVPWLHA